MGAVRKELMECVSNITYTLFPLYVAYCNTLWQESQCWKHLHAIVSEPLQHTVLHLSNSMQCSKSYRTRKSTRRLSADDCPLHSANWTEASWKDQWYSINGTYSWLSDWLTQALAFAVLETEYISSGEVMHMCKRRHLSLLSNKTVAKQKCGFFLTLIGCGNDVRCLEFCTRTGAVMFDVCKEWTLCALLSMGPRQGSLWDHPSLPDSKCAQSGVLCPGGVGTLVEGDRWKCCCKWVLWAHPLWAVATRTLCVLGILNERCLF